MQFKEYERGIDRIADLNVAEVSRDGTIHYDDIWQQYNLKFSVFSHEGDDEKMVMDFRHDSSGATRSLEMMRSSRKDKWMFNKYGIEVVPWECSIDMSNLQNSATGEFKSEDEANFHYRFRKIRAKQGDEPEREPMRFLHLQRPGLYEGQLGCCGNTQQVNTSSVYIVNGMADKCDANFIGKFFFEHIQEFNVFLGNYPSDNSDIT